MIYMSKTKTTNKWNAADRQAFADRNILRAQTIPNKKRIASKKACRGRVEW
jgi:hypothetical protein